MFELNNDELRDLRSKISSTNVSAMNRSATKVFTERGLYMLATVLKGERAREVTFAIIETFAKVRENSSLFIFYLLLLEDLFLSCLLLHII